MDSGAREARIAPEALTQMRAVAARRTDVRWAAFQNVDLGSPDCGHLQFILIGAGCTYQVRPERCPDTASGFGWRYQFVGWVNLLAGAIEAEPKAGAIEAEPKAEPRGRP